MKKKIITSSIFIIIVCCFLMGQSQLWVKKVGHKVYQLYHNAQTLPAEDMAWGRGNRNPATLFFLNQKESSLLSGTSGYGPWLETPFGQMRLVSCLSGVKGVEKSVVALELQAGQGTDIREIAAQIKGNVPLEYKVLYPFDFYGKKRIFVLFEISHQTLTEPLKLTSKADMTFCSGFACRQGTFSVALDLPANQAYMTPICAKLMFEDMHFVRYGGTLFHHQFFITNAGEYLVKINFKDAFYPYVRFFPDDEGVKTRIVKVEKQAVWIAFFDKVDFSGVLKVNHQYYRLHWPIQNVKSITDFLPATTQNDDKIIFICQPWHISGYLKRLAVQSYPFFRHLINQDKIKIVWQSGPHEGILLNIGTQKILCPFDIPIKVLKRYTQDLMQ